LLPSPEGQAKPIPVELAMRLSAPIDTERLALEPMGERHAAAFFAPLQDDAVYEWISMDKPESLEALQARWLRGEARVAPDGFTAWPTWAVRRVADGTYIGRVDAEIDANLVALNVGYYFFPAYWGEGFATEAVSAVTQHFIRMGVHRLVATVTSGNAASARVLKKAGYQFTRVLPGNDVLRGIAVDDDEYVLVVA
jgi:ribosomal-protein-alanine N-acetyltransferase